MSQDEVTIQNMTLENVISNIFKSDFQSFIVESKGYGFEIIENIKKNFNLTIGDCFEVADRSVAIKDIRELERWAHIFPTGVGKIAIINYEKLSLPASHSFLKLLEEPPKYLKIILICSDRKQVIPTILSRCQLFSITTDPNYIISMGTSELMSWEYILGLGLKELFELSFKLSKRDDIIQVVDNWIISANNKIGEEKYIWLDKLLEVKKRLISANINKRILLDNLFLSLD